jgi:uncharacterized SAM-binding protein YcdF (DUF218 family)
MTARQRSVLGRGGLATLASAGLAALLTLGVAPLVATLAVWRSARRAPTRPEAVPERILVLGHRLAGGAPSAVFAARLARALALAAAYPAARVVLLGGRGGAGVPSEAEAGRDWLVARGLDPARIVLETTSRHTLENLANHRALFGSGAPEALVTSRLHLHRALLMAHGLGLRPMPVAAEERARLDLALLAGEGFRVHWYRTGRALARLLRRRAWLARIS